MQPPFRRARAAAPAHASDRGGPSGALARQVFLDLDFTLLEMNPFTLDAAGKPFPLDMRGELDDTAAFKSGKKCARGLPPARSSHGGGTRPGHGAARGLGANTAGRSSGSRVPQCASHGLHLSTRLSLCAPAARPGGGWALVSSYGPGVLGRCPAVKESDWACRWGDVEFPLPFGRALTAAEEHIARLDASTGASLKLSILNPKGRVWTMVAGGGASVIYADTVGDLPRPPPAGAPGGGGAAAPGTLQDACIPACHSCVGKASTGSFRGTPSCSHGGGFLPHCRASAAKQAFVRRLATGRDMGLEGI